MAKFDNTRLAPLDSPVLTGDPQSTATLAPSDNDQSLATTAWVKANAGGGSASITISDTPPASPAPGAMWWESDTGGLFIYYNDGNTSQWVSVGGSAARLETVGPYTQQVFTSGSGTYTTPAGVAWIEVEMVGGGSGGNSNGAGGAGGNTTFGGSLTANGGTSGAGGAATGGGVNITGGIGTNGGPSISGVYGEGGMGAGTPFGTGGAGGYGSGGGAATVPGTGGGGGGTSVTTAAGSGSGGCAGGYLRRAIAAPAPSYAYSVGVGGTAGAAGANVFAGGAGAPGIIIVTEHYATAPSTLQPVSDNNKILLATIIPTATTSVVIGPGILTGAYDIYEIEYMVQPATSGSQMLLRMSTDGGATFIASASAYSYALQYTQATTGAFLGAANTFMLASFNATNAANAFATGTLKVYRPGVAGINKTVRVASEGWNASAQWCSFQGSNSLSASTAVVNALQLTWDTAGNFQPTGFVKVYGLR